MIVNLGPSRILALDPGYGHDGGCGVALFDHDGTLLDGDLVPSPPRAHSDVLWRTRKIALDVLTWLEGRNVEAQILVVEWPQIYAASRSPGDPNDILGLAGVCSAVAALYPWQGHRAYLPREWKGTAPKSAIGKRVLARLTEFERRCIHDWGARTHNVLDAVGLGLHHLGRLERRRVIHR